MTRRNGFSLIELLVVIAVIGILSAIIFPVYAQAKKGAYKSSDLSNMNSLRTALQLYKSDSGSYPPALLGFVGPYENVSNGRIMPPNSVQGALYPKRVQSLTTFRPALNRVAESPASEPVANLASSALVTPAYWPTSASVGAGGDRDNPKQRFSGLGDGPVNRAIPGCTEPVTNYYYILSGYDAAKVVTPQGERYETHYQLFWSGNAVPANPCAPTTAELGGATDTPRQLGYTEPPEDTVVTWDSYFRDYQGGQPQKVKADLVLFLGGNARPVDSYTVYTNAWMVKP